MTRKYSYYYCKVNLRVGVELTEIGGFEYDPSVSPLQTLDTNQEVITLMGSTYFGIRLQDMLLEKKDFRDLCNLLSEAELEAATKSDESRITSLRFAHASVVQRLGYLEEISFTLIPQDKSKTISPYNNSYPTTTLISIGKSTREFSEQLTSFSFNFGSAEQPIIYKVKLGSVKRKIQKRTSAVFN